ncbi:MAG: hypothetical protein ACI87O_001615 [Planctomycetota bacterium]|jgi:hypothetical protein
MEALLAMCQSKGLAYCELAEQSGIPIYTRNYGVTKFRGEARVDDAEPELLRVKLLEQDMVRTILIELGVGISVLVEPGFDEEHLRNIVDTLWRSCWHPILGRGINLYEIRRFSEAARRPVWDRAEPIAKKIRSTDLDTSFLTVDEIESIFWFGIAMGFGFATDL